MRDSLRTAYVIVCMPLFIVAIVCRIVVEGLIIGWDIGSELVDWIASDE